MIRITITALTLAAIATITLATAAPVLAAPSSEAPAATAEATVAPANGACAIDTELGTLPCLDRDWSLGGLSDTGTTTTDRYDQTQPTTSSYLRTGHVLAQTGATVSDSFIEEARIRSGRPDDTIDEDVESIMNAATAGASILSLDHMMIALVAVLGLIAAFGVTTVALVVFALGRRNR